MTTSIDELGITPDVITDDDKMWGALCHILPIIGIIVLFMDDKKDQPFLRYQAVHSIALNIVLGIPWIIVSIVTCGLGSIAWAGCSLFLAWKAYEGEVIELPVVTPFLLSGGHLETSKQIDDGM